MNVYIYAANIYCEDCARAICKLLDHKGLTPEHQDDETTYDSGDYPKGPYPDGGGESDCPWHCGSGPDCLNAIHIPYEGHRGWKIGAWLENELTEDGVKYVREAIQKDWKAAELWAEFYCDYDL